VQTLGHDVPRIFTATFAAGCALAALAGVIGGALRVTEPTMAQPVTAIVFAVIVIGGVGSIAGAFVASIALGLLEAAAVASAYTIGDLKLSQLAAALPFGLLVLMLVLRPQGLFGEREA
jgi:branched-chain amino acid transport system permease protein